MGTRKHKISERELVTVGGGRKKHIRRNEPPGLKPFTLCGFEWDGDFDSTGVVDIESHTICKDCRKRYLYQVFLESK